MGALESIAGISAGIVALIGLGYKIVDAIQKSAVKKHIEEGRSLEKQILEATTDEERAKLSKLLSDHRTQ